MSEQERIRELEAQLAHAEGIIQALRDHEVDAIVGKENVFLVRLRQAEEKRAMLAAIVESSEDSIISRDVNGKVTSWNVGAQRIFGYRPDEVIGQPITRIIPSELQAEEATILERVLRGESITHYETVWLAWDGRRIPVSLAMSPIRDATGAIIGASKVARDITERKQAEAALRASEQFNLALLNSLPAHIAVLDAEGTILGVNEPWLRFARENGDPAAGRVSIGVKYLDICRRAMQAGDVLAGQALTGLEALLRGEQNHFDLEYPCDSPEQARWFLMQAVKPPPAVGGAVVTHFDITGQKHADEALRESEQRFRTMADAMPQLAWMGHADGYIHWYNRRWYEYTGTTPQQMEGWGWQSVHDPLLLPGMMERWKAAIASAETFEMEFPLRGADGQYRRFLTRSIPLKDDQGRVTQWFGTNTDVEESKRAEAALHELTQRLTYHVDNSPLAVIEWGPDMRLTRWSGEAERIFGWKAEEVLGKRMEDFRWIYTEDSPGVLGVSAGLQDGTTPRRLSLNRNYRKDGSVAHCEWYNSSLLDGSGKLRSILSLVLDVTERMEAERALQEAQVKLQAHAAELETTVARRTAKLQETISDLEHFSYAITHDMRAPLRAMQGFASMLEEECGEVLTPPSREHIRRIKTAAVRLDWLITDSLNYGKVVRNQVTFEPVNLGKLIPEIVETYPNLQPDEADIETAGPLPVVLGNPAALTQCFSNLLINAVKFAKAGTKPRIRIRAEGAKQAAGSREPEPARGNQEPPLVRIWVEDDGIGIAQECQERIFRLFQRATATHEGTGIGLAIVRKVVERMGGRVGVESQEGQGSRFWVELRAAGEQKAESRNQQ